MNNISDQSNMCPICDTKSNKLFFSSDTIINFNLISSILFFIQMLTYLMVSRVAQLCPGAVLTKLDKLVAPLKLTVTTKVSEMSTFCIQ